MKVLHITNNFKHQISRYLVFFVKEQIESLSKLNIDCDVFFINRREKGKFEYLKSIIKLSKKLKSEKYDLVHCHHTLSAIVFILTGHSKKVKSVVPFQSDPPSSPRLQQGDGISGICNANFQLKYYFEMEYEKGVANSNTTYPSLQTRDSGILFT